MPGSGRLRQLRRGSDSSGEAQTLGAVKPRDVAVFVAVCKTLSTAFSEIAE